MSLEAEFVETFIDTIAWSRFTGQDSYGNDTYAASVDISARVDEDTIATGETDRQDQETGKDSRTISVITSPTTPLIQARDRFVLGGVTFVVTTSSTLRDEEGLHHQVAQATTDKRA